MASCSIDGCGKRAINSRGWCNAHYHRWQRHGDPLGGGKTRVAGLTCSVAGCGGRRHAQGLCASHYNRQLRHGDPLAGTTGNGVARSFFENIVLKWDQDSCLIWPFSRTTQGYGTLSCGTSMRVVSRIACEAANGPPPSPDHVAAHSCGRGTSGCVSPRHVAWKLQVENMADKILHGTTNRGERSGSSKLTASQASEIRRAKGVRTAKSLSAEYGISEGAIYDIFSGRKWSWLSAEADR